VDPEDRVNMRGTVRRAARFIAEVATIAAGQEDFLTTRARLERALSLINRFGGIDGAHHKTWVIDQVVRILAGDGYDEWVRQHCAGDEGQKTYSWDVGIPP
jgi:hypothetical protein